MEEHPELEVEKWKQLIFTDNVSKFTGPMLLKQENPVNHVQNFITMIQVNLVRRLVRKKTMNTYFYRKVHPLIRSMNKLYS